MSANDTETFRNRLLDALGENSLARLRPQLERIDLPIRHILIEPGEPTSHVVFFERGLGSIIAVGGTDDEEIEVGHIGREGMTPFHAVLGDDQTPNRTMIQVAGAGWQLPMASFRASMRADPALRALLLRYVHSYHIQLAHSALANGRYTIPERLARWLLMSHDRLDGDELALTHEFLSLMLGVRRSGVTTEIHILEGVHVIKATRGRIRILDRPRLEEIAGGCYGVPEREYERLIGRPLRHAA